MVKKQCVVFVVKWSSSALEEVASRNSFRNRRKLSPCNSSLRSRNGSNLLTFVAEIPPTRKKFSQFRCLCARQSAKANLTHDGSVVEEDGAPFSIVQSSSAAAQLLDDDQRRRQGKKGEMRWESAEVVSFTVSTADGGTPAGLEIANVHTKVLTCIFWVVV